MTTLLNHSFGSELKDAFKPVDDYLANGIKWLDEVQQFYRERSAIEKEYAHKLGALSKRYFDKKGKKSATLSVGDDPKITAGSLESSSMSTWSQILNETQNLANERMQLSEELIIQVADQLKVASTKEDDLRKKHVVFVEKLFEDRDKVYSEVKKAKTKYDEYCQSVESSRQKADKDLNDERGRKHFQKHLVEMNNHKNIYLLKIHIANQFKAKYFHHDIPITLDSLQDLNESRIRTLNDVFTLAANLEQDCISRSGEHLQSVISAATANTPDLDSEMFIKHNSRGWNEPEDFAFEACAIWHDNDQIATDESAVIFLRNLINKSRAQLSEVKGTVESKQREIDGLIKLKVKYAENPALGNVDEVTNNLVETIHATAFLENKALIFETEIAVITEAVEDIDAGAKPHSFKATSFTIPTACDFCKGTIWGLSRHGATCRECSYTCHTKCEMRVPASCAGEKMSKKERQAQRETMASDTASLARSNTNESFSGTAYASVSSMTAMNGSIGDRERIIGNVRHSAVTPPLDMHKVPPLLSSNPRKITKAKVLFEYEGNSNDELSVKEGEEITVLEDDDGSGWVEARSQSGKQGIVPATYIEYIKSRPDSIASSITKKKGPTVAPKRGAKKLKYMRALFDYEAQSSLEIPIREGDLILVTDEDRGDGWTEGEINGVKGQFPTNYAEFVSG
ncbi:Protein BZZ1 [Neolecta irregularis DAH-3]|uniref:Protein BZZ1 n=1 Tax=Neolecta irregularis (strain DAH-3) TaxID=1198029 RepID=A0A1U7LKK9_NEOID|nr:Protein BZZ1 [Neolecta irregularis DAH-3]|eukprot:OLL23196.1 Protein BZZ1 [Neolecta irregularis DAH-3]